MSGTYITVTGLDECLKAFNGLEKELRKNANGELRKASKEIAGGLVQMLPSNIAGTSSPQASVIVAAAGPKSDRYVVVAVPNKKPRLSGLKKTPAAQAKRLGWAIEGGSDYPAFKGPQAGSIASNHREKMAKYAIPRYTSALAGIMRKYQLI